MNKKLFKALKKALGISQTTLKDGYCVFEIDEDKFEALEAILLQNAGLLGLTIGIVHVSDEKCLVYDLMRFIYNWAEKDGLYLENSGYKLIVQGDKKSHYLKNR